MKTILEPIPCFWRWASYFATQSLICSTHAYSMRIAGEIRIAAVCRPVDRRTADHRRHPADVSNWRCSAAGRAHPIKPSVARKNCPSRVIESDSAHLSISVVSRRNVEHRQCSAFRTRLAPPTNSPAQELSALLRSPARLTLAELIGFPFVFVAQNGFHSSSDGDCGCSIGGDSGGGSWVSIFSSNSFISIPFVAAVKLRR